MATNYPFPLPEAIQNEADEVISHLGNHPGAYLMYPPNANPQCLNVFDSCLLELSIIHEAIEEAGSNLSELVEGECDKGESLFHAATKALEAELDRMEHLLDWGRLTWRYDPTIRKAFSGDSTPPAPEPEKPALASAPTN